MVPHQSDTMHYIFKSKVLATSSKTTKFCNIPCSFFNFQNNIGAERCFGGFFFFSFAEQTNKKINK